MVSYKWKNLQEDLIEFKTFSRQGSCSHMPPLASMCLPDSRSRAGITTYLSLRARIIFIDSFLRKLLRDASWETCSKQKCQSSANQCVVEGETYTNRAPSARRFFSSCKELGSDDSLFDKKYCQRKPRCALTWLPTSRAVREIKFGEKGPHGEHPYL